MAKTTKKRKGLLPKHPPKRTGKRGPRPLDAKDDFDKPSKKKDKDQLLTAAARQARLPGMEDSAISVIESAAHEYASMRDRRMALLKKELELKAALRKIMQRNTTKSTYRHDDVLVILTPPKEGGVKVVIGDEEKLDAVQKAAETEAQVQADEDAIVGKIEDPQAEDDAKEMAKNENLSEF